MRTVLHMLRHGYGAIASLIVVLPLSLAIPARAQEQQPAASTEQPAASADRPGALPSYEVGGQATIIGQQLFKFHSPYSGPNSLKSRDEAEVSETFTLFLGARVTKSLDVYIDPEMALGNGVGTALGLAGVTNGDVIRNPTIGSAPYIARVFARYTIAAGSGTEKADADENQIPQMRPTHRVVLTAGKYGSNDIFDTNAYANSTRTQFMNWVLINNAAYDYAADTRGYTEGVAAEWYVPGYAFRVGSFQMPTIANGTNLADNLTHSRGDQVEFESHPQFGKLAPAVVRLLGYRNLADMGDYRTAIALGKETDSAPNIIAVRKSGSVKYGFGMSAEQPLRDNGDTGLFARAGWDDGKTESFAYTEADRSLSAGIQVSGAHWHRPADRWCAALAQSDLSSAHRDYLAAGGLGFLLGDGRLHYGSERVLETYYTFPISRPVSLSMDYQGIANPGYNHDRGPLSVVSLRLHAAF